MWLQPCAEVRRDIEGKEITLSCTFVGRDLLLLCYGGDAPHIGAASLAVPYTNGKGGTSASVSTMTAPEHRDDAVSRELAERFSKACGRAATAVCGIHFENASADLIGKIKETVADMATELIARVQSRP